MIRILLWVALLLLPCSALRVAQAAVPDFFAPPVPSGNLDVHLHPTEGVAIGVPTVVTFGLPLPRGSLTVAQLNSVRVFSNGLEIPAHVEQLTPWRHRRTAALDGTSVRIALIQIQHSFSLPFPNYESISVQWGGAARTLNVPVLADARAAWHQVTSGSFVAADNVFEPDVYAVLPRNWLAQGLLRPTRTLPFDVSNTNARDDPGTNDAIEHWPNYQEADRALKNNFYSVINQDDPQVVLANQCPYKTEREPWLYDRAATMFVLYLRSGSFSALREAVRATGFYGDRLDGQGFFTVGGAQGDSKYAYNESLAYTYWLTGDPLLPARIALVPTAHEGYPHVWTPTRNFWTERHAAFKLLANAVAYEVSGDTTVRARVDQLMTDYRAHQDGASGQIPAQRIDGGLYHYGFQHDYDFDENSFGGSSWMSALLSDAAVRAYSTDEDVATAGFIKRLGNFLRATVVTTLEHSYDTYEDPLALPRYAMLIDGSDGQRNYEDVEHALDVAGQLAWATYFSELLGAPNAALRQSATDLYFSYDIGVNFWIRPAAPPLGYTAFRVAPWRKWGWEHRTSDGLGFALSKVIEAPMFADGFE